MTGKRSLLMDSTLRPSDKSHITFADTGKSKVLGLGRVAISKDQHMDKVMLVESLGFNLMSVSMLCDLNMIVMFGKYRCLVLMESDKSLVFEGYQKDDLYVVDFSAGPQLAVCLLAKASECWLWHRRLGHAGMRNLHTLAKKKHVIGIEGVKFKKDHLCGACETGKMTRAKIPRRQSWPLLDPSNCFRWIFLVPLITQLLLLLLVSMALSLLMIILDILGCT